MNGEEWRTVLDGAYEVSNLGNMRRAKPGRRTYVGRPVKPIVLMIGYLAVRPVVDGKNVQMFLHHIVASSFLGPRPSGMSINHRDGDKTNNRVENLEYVTHAENMAHAARTGLMARGESHPGAKVSNADVEAIRARRANGEGLGSLSSSFGLAKSTLSQICNGHRRTA